MPMCQASLLGVPYSLPSPEALPQQDSRARGCIVCCTSQDDAFVCLQHFFPPCSFSCVAAQTQQHTHTNTSQVQTLHQVHPSFRHGGKSPLHPVLYGGFLEGDPILFPLPWCLVGWLALMQRGVCWRGGFGLGQCAQKLMNCRRDAERQPKRSSGKRPSRAITVCLCDGGNQRDSADNLI